MPTEHTENTEPGQSPSDLLRLHLEVVTKLAHLTAALGLEGDRPTAELVEQARRIRSESTRQAAEIVRLAGELEAAKTLLTTPAALRRHCDALFPDYAWESREYFDRLKAGAEKGDQLRAELGRLYTASIA